MAKRKVDEPEYDPDRTQFSDSPGGEFGPEVRDDSGLVPDKTQEEKDLADRTAELGEAEKILAEAKENLATAQAAREAAVEALATRPVAGESIMLDDGQGTFATYEAPKNARGEYEPHNRTVTVGGKNYEHVSDLEVEGGAVWRYRHM